MFKIVNLCEVVMCYKNLFQDEGGCWLRCPGEFEKSQCVCLDFVQLDLAGLHIDKNDNPDISFTRQAPYIVALFDSVNNTKANESLTWCNDRLHIRNASLSKHTKKTKNMLHIISNYGLILVVLCLYKANTNNMREKVTEFYLASYPKAFTKYVHELAKKIENSGEVTDDNALPDDVLAKHIAMIQRILNVYANNDARESFWTGANLYDALTCYGFKQSIAKEPIEKDRLKNKLEEIRKEYNDTKFLPDEDFLNKIHIIFKAINTDQPGLGQNMREIVKNLDCLNKKSADFNEKKNNIMWQINSLLSKFL